MRSQGTGLRKMTGLVTLCRSRQYRSNILPESVELLKFFMKMGTIGKHFPQEWAGLVQSESEGLVKRSVAEWGIGHTFYWDWEGLIKFSMGADGVDQTFYGNRAKGERKVKLSSGTCRFC